MKQKSLALRGVSLLKWHSLVFALCMIIMWWSALSTFSYPGNDRLPFEMFRSFIIDRIWITILWGFVLMLHAGQHQIRAWLQARDREAHFNSMQAMQARYIPANQLELEGDDEQSSLYDEYEAEHLKSKQ